MVILPVVAYVFSLATFWLRGHDWRRAAILAACLWGVAVVVITELLSIPRELTRHSVAISWLVLDLAGLYYLVRAMRSSGLQIGKITFRKTGTRDAVTSALVAWTCLVLAIVALVGFLAPPNTWDAMEYHMPRVVHWISNRSVAFYPTYELKQLHMPPWAEYAMLQFHILVPGDRLDNLVQWFSMAGSVIGVSLITKSLGAGRRGQALAALISATIPEGILEASGAKNDYSLTFWLVVAVYFILCFNTRPNRLNILGAASSVGLACLTKGTAFVFAPTIIAILALSWKRERQLQAARYVPLALAIILALNFGQFYRNYSLYGSPLGPAAETPSGDFKYMNDSFGPAPFVENLTRNIALHLGTPSQELNHKIEGAVTAVTRAVGGNVNDPRTTWTATTFHVPEMTLHEATAGNPLDLVMIIVAFVVAGIWTLKRRHRQTVVYALGLSFAFVAFVVVFRWQPWHTRLHLPLFVLWAAVIGLMLENHFSEYFVLGLAGILLLAASPALIENSLRPLAYAGQYNVLNSSRIDQYFADHKDIESSYVNAAQAARAQGCGRVALDMSVERYEYPLLVLLGEAEGSKPIPYGIIDNPSGRYQLDTRLPEPCSVIFPGYAQSPQKVKQYTDQGRHMQVFGNVAVFGPTNPASGVSPGQGSCTMTLSTGWDKVEVYGTDWLRWTADRGEARISSSTEQDVILRGLATAAPRPDTMGISLNGAAIASVDLNSGDFQIFSPVTLHLKPGNNVLDFTSKNPAIVVPPDTRKLAIALRDLSLARKDGEECTVVRQGQ